MYCGEKSREAETGQLSSYRLVADAKIPGFDHGIDAADQIVDRRSPIPPWRTGTRLSAELSWVSFVTNRWPDGTVTSGIFILLS